MGAASPAGCKSNAEAAAAAVGLVPQWAGHEGCTRAEPLGGASRCVFRLTNAARPGERYCLRLLRPGQDEQLVSTTRALGAAGLTPELVGASGAALAQRWVAGGPPPVFLWREDEEMERLARFIARLHGVAVAQGTEEMPKARPEDLRALAERVGVKLGDRKQVVLDEVRRLERDLPAGQRPLVTTHGDLHLGNLLESGGRLWAIDLETVGARPCETDLAYFFLGLALGHVLKAYPSLESRRRFGAAYLEERGRPCDDAAVDGLLHAVEREWPFQAAWLALIYLQYGIAEKLAGMLLLSVPHARRALVRARKDEAMHQEVLRQGVGGVAFGEFLRCREAAAAEERAGALVEAPVTE